MKRLVYILIVLLLLLNVGCSATKPADKAADATLQATKTPQAISTPTPFKPLETPTSAPTTAQSQPEPTPFQAPQEDALVYSGDSPTVLDNIELGDWVYRAAFTYNGSKYAMVYDNKKLAITSIGKFDGSFALSGNKSHNIEIDADGPWEFVISPVQITDTMNFSGNGYVVSDVFIGDASKSGVYSLSHKGSGSFLVMLYASGYSPKIVTSKIGDYTGEVLLEIEPSTTYIWVVQASDGDWEIKKVR